ncbi:amidophosphoribosyltransferase [Coprobacter fastidiosus]|jgi:amidophosphoribosyltransferase|uniref:Amidophosphoribosyltransferase n=3 Tax=Coprobacter fastidiosus TaxID=1099853 RepID=A0A495WJD0_9BACT|nr:amidophosphoribosyltransferase [Coprobacter fastidiosus]EHL88453.1 amidophosphoribosyltransferase [Tannerella sp. 6_1_58FAA_CT1]MBS6410144.1 amidophosphoribosyltransferase [Tannerella sp.]RHS45140.1 amidophosphoribosyltransferase [Tannerella sp. AF04-6]ERM89694.1 amidophosphoribosyltransferase [Coprobacter fastidiosus NSB1 = JCM 33896]RKT61224.1 amidophosphoribosyltransferase [Coprobacter fastidiosus NSB1 = JCM 33896]
MGGFFGTIKKENCVADLFYGVDYNSHMGTKRGGMVTLNNGNFTRSIHNIENSYFRTKFEADLPSFSGNSGIGVISDTDAQPIIINSHLGKFAVVTVAKVTNLPELEKELLAKGNHFCEHSNGITNQSELVSMLIIEGKTFVEGIENVYNRLKGSCSMLLLTENGIIAARDKYGRTPIMIGKGKNGYAVSSETCSFPNLGYEMDYNIGPGEIVQITADGFTQLRKPNKKMQICSFLWVYYGYPVCEYEGKNVDEMRFDCGVEMGKNDDIDADFVSGIPDSGVGMSLGYAVGKQIPYKRAIVKYTPTWPRSFTPPTQEMRELVAKMKLIPNKKLLKDKKVVFCDDSIVRGTQLHDNVNDLYRYGAKEVHMRISCPPLIYPCKFLNFTGSKSELELITRRVIKNLEGDCSKNLPAYATTNSPQYCKMVDCIRKDLNITTLKFNPLETLVKSIGLPKECICTHCFDGSSYE